MTYPKLTLENVIALHQSGQLAEAEAGYLALLEKFPDDCHILHPLGILYVELNQFVAAIEYLEKAYQLDPTNLPISLHLANVYKLQGQFNKAVQLLQNIISTSPDYAAAYNNLGTVYFAQAKLELAVTAYEKAIQLKPHFIDAYYNLALAQIKAQDNLNANATLQTLLQLAPEHMAARFQLALLTMQKKAWAEAIKLFSEILAQYDHMESHVNIATCYLQQGSLIAAKEHYLKAIAIEQDKQALFNLAIISTQQNYIQDAIVYYQQILTIDKQHFAAQNNLATTYLLLGKREQALAHFQRALSLNPENKTLEHTVRILLQKGDINHSPPEYITDLFNSYAEHYDIHLQQVLGYSVPQRFQHLLQTHCQQASLQGIVLDLGCGTGLCGQILKPLASKLIGVDLARNMLTVAAAKQIYDELINADVIAYLHSISQQFDLIVAADLVVYFGDVAKLFTVIKQALKPNGYFIFNTEISTQQNFMMLPSGRFAQRKDYLFNIGMQLNFKLIHYVEQILRYEAGKPVNGQILLLQNV